MSRSWKLKKDGSNQQEKKKEKGFWSPVVWRVQQPGRLYKKTEGFSDLGEGKLGDGEP